MHHNRHGAYINGNCMFDIALGHYWYGSTRVDLIRNADLDYKRFCKKHGIKDRLDTITEEPFVALLLFDWGRW